MKTNIIRAPRGARLLSSSAAFAALVALTPSIADAQEEEAAEIVVTAPLEGSRIESLQGAEVLRRDDLIAQLNGGLGDTLDATPGIATTFFGAGASRPIIRGLGEDRVRVLQNGIGAIDASTASPDHAVTSDALDAERIEILRGAAALAYGGNAIGGVVNVIDQSIPTRAIDGMRGNALAAYSSVDEGLQGDVDVGFGAGDFAFRLGGARRETGDYDTPLGRAPNSWTDAASVGAGASFVRDWGFAGAAVKHTENSYGLLPEDASEPGGRIEMEQTRIETRGDLRLPGFFNRLDFGAQHSDYEHTEFEADGEAGTRFFSEGWEARLEAHHRDARHIGAIGLQATDVDFNAVGEEAFISATNTRDLGLFAIERYDLGGWGVEGGLRYERREIDNAAFGARDFDNVSASAGIFFRPAANWFTGATLAHTERAPTAFELFSDGPHLATANYELGSPDLAQERALSFEASLRYDSGPARFEINLFRVDFEDYIALVERGDVFWLDEATDTSGFAPDASDPGIPADSLILPVFSVVQQDAVFTGGEISAGASLFETAGFTFAGDAALDIVRAEFDAGGHPPRIPPYSLTLGLEAKNAHWSGRIEAVHTGKQDRLAAFETPTDNHTFLNASLVFRPMGEDGPWSLRLDGRNLTDELGRVHSSFLKDELPLPGRNLRLTLIVDF